VSGLLVLAALVATATAAFALLDPPFPRAALPTRSDAALVLSGDVDYRRLERAAALYRQGRVPILVLTGTGTGIGGDSALAMRDFAASKLEVPAHVILVEARSTTTRENLMYASELLRRNRLHAVLLVTSASHMGRALRAAQRAVPEVTWTPVAVDDVGPASRIYRTRGKEWLKLLWYWLRGWA
jgi:uncharacterized SAM-binding protein YcdF (DUF218 family)